MIMRGMLGRPAAACFRQVGMPWHLWKQMAASMWELKCAKQVTPKHCCNWKRKWLAGVRQEAGISACCCGNRSSRGTSSSDPGQQQGERQQESATRC